MDDSVYFYKLGGRCEQEYDGSSSTKGYENHSMHDQKRSLKKVLELSENEKDISPYST